MATFRKCSKSVPVEVYKNGVRQSATFDSITQAREWAAQTESAIIESKSTDIVSNKTVSDAFERYAEDVDKYKTLTNELRVYLWQLRVRLQSCHSTNLYYRVKIGEMDQKQADPLIF